MSKREGSFISGRGCKSMCFCICVSTHVVCMDSLHLQAGLSQDVSVYVCVCYMYLCVYMYVCISVYLCISVCVYLVYVCIYVSLCVYMNVYIFVYLCISEGICVSV